MEEYNEQETPQEELTQGENVGNADVSAEEDAPKTSRQLLRDRLSEYDPEGDYEDDENFYNGLNRYADERDTELGDFREFDSRIRKAIDEDPHSGMFIVNLLDGMDFVENLYEVLGPDLMQALQSDRGVEKYKEMMAKAKEMDAERQRNEEKAAKTYEEWSLDKDSETLEAFGESFVAMLEEFKSGDITAETLDALWKGFNYDTDTAEAEDLGRVQGRNERISAQLRQREGGDGLPNLSDTSAAKAKVQTPRNESNSIWDRDYTK